MTLEERKSEISKIQIEKLPYMTGIPLMYHGERKQFNVYEIPLSFLTYNPYNGRIGSEVKSYERQNHPLNPDVPADVRIIEDFLWESKKAVNENTMLSLLNEHQQKYGIVTADGRIIDGNRRACLLNRLWNDPKLASNQKQHCQWFYAIILPLDADKKEILRLETTYQMGEDAKVDYGPIEKYLKCGDLKEAGFTNQDIANFMGVKQSDIKTYLYVLELMNDYLDTYGYTGIYTQLDGNEDSFLKLETALRKYKSGGVSSMWDYSTESDVSDLKQIAFDYIRAGFDQVDFRDIIHIPTKNKAEASLFANKDIWQDFSDRHFQGIKDIKEKPVDDLLKENPSGNINRQLRARDSEWREKVKPKLDENFFYHKDKLSNKQEASEPLKLLKKSLEALSAVDTEIESFKTNPEIKEIVKNINKISWEYKKILE